VEKCQEEKKERTLIQDATLLLFCAGKAHYGKINKTLILLCATFPRLRQNRVSDQLNVVVPSAVLL
jgi:hypothetical protein